MTVNGIIEYGNGIKIGIGSLPSDGAVGDIQLSNIIKEHPTTPNNRTERFNTARLPCEATTLR